jgi:hypothetical protein
MEDEHANTGYRRRGERLLRPVYVPPGSTYTTRLLPGFSINPAELEKLEAAE